MRYRLSGGNHVINDKTYTSGDVIETNLELDKIFARTRKFTRIDNNDPIQGGVVTAAPSNIDVTALFNSNAASQEIKVVQKGNSPWYDVVDLTTGKVLNDKSLRKNQVEGFLKEYME